MNKEQLKRIYGSDLLEKPRLTRRDFLGLAFMTAVAGFSVAVVRRQDHTDRNIENLATHVDNLQALQESIQIEFRTRQGALDARLAFVEEKQGKFTPEQKTFFSTLLLLTIYQDMALGFTTNSLHEMGIPVIDFKSWDAEQRDAMVAEFREFLSLAPDDPNVLDVGKWYTEWHNKGVIKG